MKLWSSRLAAVALMTTVGTWGCGGAEQEATAAGQPMTAVVRKADGHGNRPPVVERVVLSPSEPTPGHPVEARAEASDPDGDAVRLDFAWEVNGRPWETGRGKPVIRTDSLRKGDRITVEVTATDGHETSTPRQARTAIGNRPPRLDGVFLLPDGTVRPGDELVAQVEAGDPDGDDLEVHYRWLENGRALSRESMERLDTSALTRGSRIRVEAWVSDGRARSRVRSSREVELANSPPVLARIPRLEGVDGTFRHQLEASDPDGDRNLRFRLVQGPAGMTVDPVVGTLVWTPEAEQAGRHPVEVAVEDNHGDGTSLLFELTVDASREPAGEAAPPAARAEP